MTISDEAIEAATNAHLEHIAQAGNWEAKESIRAALEAAEPFIRESVLLEAADGFAPSVARSVLIEKPEAIYDATVNRGRDWLRSRAAEMRQG